MHMIGSHMPLHDLDIQRSANLSRQIPHLFPDLSSQSRLAVLGDEHKVISQPILRHLRSVPPSLLKASPKGEGVHPSQSGTLTPAATNLFEVPEPVQIGHRVYDNNHIHRSRRGELRISKSEVIIANELAV